MSEPTGSKKLRTLGQAALWEYALRALGSRAHSISELREKLRRRAASAGDIDKVLLKLKRYGYLNDRRYAEAYAAARLENQGFGRGRVLRDLRQRRVPPAVARQAVEEVFENTDETRLIEDFLRRKYRKTELSKHLAEPRNLASAYRKLRYAGFSPANSIRVLKRYSQRAEELESLDEGQA